MVLAGLLAVGCGSEDDSLTYAAIGDSYSSGEGTRDSGDECGRSPAAYPELLAEQLRSEGRLEAASESTEQSGPAFVFVACSGAEIPDVESQLDALGDQRFDLVTLTVGGNDVGFLDTLIDCVGADDVIGALLDRDIGRALERGCSFDETELEQRTGPLAEGLDELYERIVGEHLADDGRLVVLGYPQLFEDPSDWSAAEGDSCDGFAKADAQLLRAAAEKLNATIRETAEGTERVVFVDQVPAFDGHGRCSEEPWINGFEIRPRVLASFHPDESGHEASARAVSETIES
ncbi:MAG: SGNH/GDSL hydrolase family protein [Microthrixaceae bacterium]|nr:SGNH/GDSL hydrolase family protein [Microthrixaceae bacterium]